MINSNIIGEKNQRIIDLIIEWGLLLFIFCLPLKGGGKVFLYISLLGWIISAIIRGKTFFLKTDLDIPIIGYLLIGLISSINSIAPYESLKFYYYFIITQIIPYYLIINNFHNKEKIKHLVIILGLSSFLVSLTGIIKLFFLGETSAIGGINAFGIDWHNSVAMYLVATFPFVLTFNYIINLKKLKIIIYAIIMIVIGGIVLCYSRGGWIALFSSILIWIIFSKHRKIILTMLLITIIIVITFLYPKFKERVITSDFKTFTGRTDLAWKPSIEIIKEHLLLGIGFYDAKPYEKESGNNIYGPHNMFLSVGIQSGLAGMLIYIAIFSIFIYKIINKIYKLDDCLEKQILVAILSSIVGEYLIHGMVEVSNRGRCGVLLWTIIGMGMAINNIPEKSS